MLAGRARQDGGRRVPVVAGGDDHAVDRLVVENAAEVADRRRGRVVRLLRDFLNGCRRGVHTTRIDIADGRDLNAGQRRIESAQIGPPTARAHDAKVDLGAIDRTSGVSEIRGHGGGREKRSTRWIRHDVSKPLAA